MNVAIFGGATGGLGKQLAEKMSTRYSIFTPSSKMVDIANIEHCKKFFDENSIDIVVNAAGKNFDKFIHKFDIEDDLDIYDVLETNVRGSVNIASTALPHMREQSFGRLIYISSILSTKEVLGTSLYSSCKAFIDKFVKMISAENINKGVTANSIQLGYFDGGLTYKLPNPESYKEKIPLKRWGTIGELSDTIEYLINTEYITGQNIQLGGGV